MSDVQFVIGSTNPDGTFSAHVEDDGRVVYLYLSSHIDAGPPLSAAWVANRDGAPYREARDMAPMNPPSYCRHPLGIAPLNPETIELVWLPEGDGVALFDGDDLLAAILPWTEETGTPGYARDAIGDGPVALGLERVPEIRQWFDDARAYWAEWDADGAPWTAIPHAELEIYETQFGPRSGYFGIDHDGLPPGEGWPPGCVARYDLGPVTMLTTVGVAVRPMPALWRYTATPARYRRIELGAAIAAGSSEEAVRAVTGYLGAQARLPWMKSTFLAHGHTLPADVFAGIGYPAVLLTAAGQGPPTLELPAFRGDPVTMLWLSPITADERQFAIEYGSDALLDRMQLPRILRVT